MIRASLIALASIAVMVGTVADASPCRDAKTKKFIKCPAAAAAVTSNVVKDAKGKCHIAAGPNKGKFTKCA